MLSEDALLELLLALRKIRGSGPRGRERYRDIADLIEDAARYDGEHADAKESAREILRLLKGES